MKVQRKINNSTIVEVEGDKVKGNWKPNGGWERYTGNGTGNQDEQAGQSDSMEF